MVYITADLRFFIDVSMGATTAGGGVGAVMGLLVLSNLKALAYSRSVTLSPSF